MQKFYSVSDVRNADNIAAVRYKTPSALLMENAASYAAGRIAETTPVGALAVLMAGGGNNGGDAFAAARLLASIGRRAAVFKTKEDGAYKNDAALNLELLKNFAAGAAAFEMDKPSIEIYDSEKCSDEFIAARLAESSCIGDALLGTGAHGAPRGETTRLIEIINRFDNIVAFDIPSGIDPETGAVYSPCVKAAETASFLAPKTGMGLFPAAEMCGEVRVGSIGVPPEDVLPAEAELELWDPSDLEQLMPAVPQDIHKTERGSLLIFSGSGEYRGAPLLCARGALRAGAGLVFLAVPDFIAPFASEKLPEAIVVPLPTMAGRVIGEEAAVIFDRYSEVCGAAAIGPGCGRGDECGDIFGWFWNSWRRPLIIDADMLFFLARDKAKLSERGDILITPHSGEAARILGTTANDIDADRMGSVRNLAETAGAALLKGRRTLIAARGGRTVSAVRAGSPALAVPGSGDVLTGACGAFIAGGISPAKAGTAAALVHGAAGECLFDKYGPRGLLASEIADEMPVVLKRYA